MAAAPRILMCPPDYYGVYYVINPWMDVARQADHAAAVDQWRRLCEALTAAGAEISLVGPVEGLPDMVFTANAGLIYRKRAIVSRFRHSQRQGEEEHFRRWLSEHGFETIDAPAGHAFEGAGDALFCGDTLYAGYRQRSDAIGHQQIGARLGVRVLPLELVSAHYYHLDTCFCPLSADAAIWFSPAFDEYGQRVIRANIPRLIDVEEAEAQCFACNAAVVGRTVITNTGCPRLHEQLREAGYAPVETPLNEFVKAGGSAKCLTLRLDGEEAAAWREQAGVGD
ncbi:MAG: amidinotransferase [Pirellulales bacterium]|nr:amidinotransferase [Pirellulales bacterium]